jgi:hypothetical protein
MLCTFCNMVRLDNEAPCPRCGAPSPLLSNAQSGFGGGMPSTNAWASPSELRSQMPPSDQRQQTSAQPFQIRSQAEQQQPVSLLPVPYQAQQVSFPFQPGSNMAGSSLIPLPAQNINALLPALPDQGESVYVPPMYTKPRPIIPRYRAISGLLSVLIVTLLLCTGAGYYAKASGKLNVLGQFTGFAAPSNLKPTPTQILPDAPTAQVAGPAYNIINSATTTANINSQGVATKTDTVFKPNQTIYVTYSVHPLKAPGIVTVKWYTDGAFYQANPPSQLISSPMAGRTQAAYAQSAEGKVELYWNDQLAVSLFFVVR